MKIRVLLLIAIVFTGPMHAQNQLSKSQQTVQQTLIKMFDALSNRDSVNLKLYCTPDILLFENGEIWNIDTLITRAVLQNTAADFERTNTFDFISTKVEKNIAWVSYTLQSAIMRNGKQGFVKWIETVILVKKKNQWKIKLLHSTLIKRI